LNKFPRCLKPRIILKQKVIFKIFVRKVNTTALGRQFAACGVCCWNRRKLNIKASELMHNFRERILANTKELSPHLSANDTDSTQRARNSSSVVLAVNTRFALCSARSSDLLCGLVVRVPGYRSICPGSIHGATGFSEKY
jgi:hypothetical protein